jgi:hypothetical protein
MLLIIERSGERVARYAHNVERMMNVPQQAVALLAVLPHPATRHLRDFDGCFTAALRT